MTVQDLQTDDETVIREQQEVVQHCHCQTEAGIGWFWQPAIAEIQIVNTIQSYYMVPSKQVHVV